MLAYLDMYFHLHQVHSQVYMNNDSCRVYCDTADGIPDDHLDDTHQYLIKRHKNMKKKIMLISTDRCYVYCDVTDGMPDNSF